MATGEATLFKGDVRTMDAAGTRAEAVATRGGVIVAVGSARDVAAAVPVARVRDVATQLPWLIDAHTHACIALHYGGVVRLTPPRVTDIASLQQTIAEAAKATPPGDWVVAFEWDELRLRERRAPTREELDDAVPDRPF